MIDTKSKLNSFRESIDLISIDDWKKIESMWEFIKNIEGLDLLLISEHQSDTLIGAINKNLALVVLGKGRNKIREFNQVRSDMKSLFKIILSKLNNN